MISCHCLCFIVADLSRLLFRQRLVQHNNPHRPYMILSNTEVCSSRWRFHVFEARNHQSDNMFDDQIMLKMHPIPIRIFTLLTESTCEMQHWARIAILTAKVLVVQQETDIFVLSSSRQTTITPSLIYSWRPRPSYAAYLVARRASASGVLQGDVTVNINIYLRGKEGLEGQSREWWLHRKLLSPAIAQFETSVTWRSSSPSRRDGAPHFKLSPGLTCFAHSLGRTLPGCSDSDAECLQGVRPGRT